MLIYKVNDINLVVLSDNCIEVDKLLFIIFSQYTLQLS